MNKLIIAPILVIAIVFTVQAQAQSTQDIEVAADVQAAITFSDITNVNFGTISQNSGAYLNANTSDDPDANVGENAQTGAFTVAGDATAAISFGTATLADGDGTNTLTFTPSIFENSANTEVLPGGTDFDLSAGPLVFTVGGALDAATVAGDYSTTNTNGSNLTITVQYTGI
ncbi:MAG: hypothetical protein WD529_02260 [Balneolaceae bacterium]